MTTSLLYISLFKSVTDTQTHRKTSNFFIRRR